MNTAVIELHGLLNTLMLNYWHIWSKGIVLYLFKRRGIYQLYYIDETENRDGRISIGCKIKQMS